MQVTQDPSRLARLLFTLNGKAGMLVKPVEDLASFAPSPSLSPFRGSIEGTALGSIEETRMLGYTVSLRSGESLELPAELAVYLTLKGLFRPERGWVRVVV
jgi:hypothetical protein